MGIGKERNLGSVPARDLTEEIYARLREAHPDLGSYVFRRLFPNDSYDQDNSEHTAITEAAAVWLDSQLALLHTKLNGDYVGGYFDAVKLLDQDTRQAQRDNSNLQDGVR